jgi:hypothetical protein
MKGFPLNADLYSEGWKIMGYDWWNNDEYDFKVDIKQDIETYIDWDVDTDIDVDIKKDVDIKIDADVDVKDQGALLNVIVKDIDLKDDHDYDPYPASTSDDGGDGGVPDAFITGGTTAIENVLSSSDVTVATTNTFADLSAQALDQSATQYGNPDYPYFDSATFTEINLAIDNVVGEYTIITLDMQALVDG